MATVHEFALANIARVDIITEEESPVTYSLVDQASEANVEAFLSEGKEDILRVKNVIKALNKLEDIAMGYDITLSTVTMLAEVFALIDGGTLVTADVAQVETATVVGTVTTAGNAKVTVTANGMTGSPKDISVAVAENDTASDVAGKIRTALGLDAAVTALFTVGGTSATVTLTAKTAGVQDNTLNIAITNDTCAGITQDLTSANTTDGGVSSLSYDAPPVGTPVSRTLFTMKVYTEDKDVNGETKGYVRFDFLHCKGKPVNYAFKDGEFFAEELKLSSRPAYGESPVSLAWVNSLPA
jgi:hypothetical protein